MIFGWWSTYRNYEDRKVEMLRQISDGFVFYLLYVNWEIIKMMTLRFAESIHFDIVDGNLEVNFSVQNWRTGKGMHAQKMQFSFQLFTKFKFSMEIKVDRCFSISVWVNGKWMWSAAFSVAAAVVINECIWICQPYNGNKIRWRLVGNSNTTKRTILANENVHVTHNRPLCLIWET